VLLCHCRAISDRVIRQAIACGARCPDDVARACGAGADCGGCRSAVEELLAEAGTRTVATPVRRSA
jgi:bacterioferritin-associated ferredoxin